MRSMRRKRASTYWSAVGALVACVGYGSVAHAALADAPAEIQAAA